MGITQSRIDSQVRKPEHDFDNLLDYFNFYLFPLALNFGMNYDQFWNDDPELFFSYLEAYEMRMKTQMQYDNQMAFIQGQYYLLALQQVLQFKTPVKKIYPKKPFDILGSEQKQLTPEEKQLQSEEIRKLKMKELSAIFKKNRR